MECCWFLLAVLCMFTARGVFAVKTSYHYDARYVSVTGGELVTSARSRIDCARLCRKYSHCVSWAFVKGRGTCYLHPITNSTPSSDGGVNVYTEEDPTCQKSTAPSDVIVMTWQRSLTSFVANVTCQPDFMYYSMRCLATSQWETISWAGICKQRIWRQDTATANVDYSLPDSPGVGWAVCLTGTPVFNTGKFVFFFEDDQGNVLLQIGVRLDYTLDMRYYRMTNFNYKLGGSWGPDPVRLWDSPEYPFPFDNGQQFDLNITAVADDVFAVYVDDIHYVDYQLPAPVSTITSFKFRDDLQVHYLDLWCVL